MKQTLRKIISTSAVSVLAFSAMAQDGSKATTDRPAYSQDRLQDRSESISDQARVRDQNPIGQVGQQPGQQIGPQGLQQAGQGVQQAGHIQGAAKASELVGMDVNNNQNEKLGTVKDLAVDVESGRIVQVILASGGFVGIGEKLNAVPPGALHHDVDKAVLHLNASQAQWDSAPAFEMSKWAESSDFDQLSAVYGHYGQESAFGFVDNADSKRDVRLSAKDSSAIAASPRGDAIRDKDVARSSGERQSTIPASRLGLAHK